MAQYAKDNREHLLALKRAHYHKNPERQARLNRLREYGLTEADYQTMVVESAGKCALCSKSPGRMGLAIDHDHATGRVRGLLCFPCNAALGTLGDDVAGLTRALTYVTGG